MSAETIYALSSGHWGAMGPTGVGVIRVSGSQVRAIIKAFCGDIPRERMASLRTLVNPQTNDPLDQALVLYFQGPHSFTGEDVVEFHVHGGRAVIGGVLGALSSFAQMRMAEPGEFSRRAFENGKLDLLEVEGLADLIEADTSAQKTQALAQMGGVFSRLYEGWRGDLIHAIALVESALDFSDEGDVPEDIASGAMGQVKLLYEAINSHLDDGHRGEIVRDGYRVAIVGAPNAGKSSLMNGLAQRDVVIVCDEAGTTRDVVEVRLDIDGLSVIVSDTAGLRETTSKVELEGIARSFKQIEQASLILWMIDGTAPEVGLPDQVAASDALVLKIWNKVDLAAVDPAFEREVDLALSAEQGTGLDQLVERISEIAKTHMAQTQMPKGMSFEGVLITRARHRDLLLSALEGLRDFLDGDLSDTELRAEDLRRAAFAIGRLTGKVDVEDILDKLFIEFCIGK